MTKVLNITVTSDDDGIRLDRWFKRHHPNISHGLIEKALRKGQIKIDGKKVKSNYRISKGEIIRVPPIEETVKNKEQPSPSISDKYIKMIEKSVIYKDKNLIIINKPQGLAVQGGSKIKISVDSLLEYLKFDLTNRPKLVHRLDKDTSGVLCLARNTKAAAEFAKLLKAKEINKTYLAIVIGKVRNKTGEVNFPLMQDTKTNSMQKVICHKNGSKSLTKYQLIDYAAKEASLLELKPITGRKHQLRVHMNEIGHPILGDGKYGGKEAFINGLSNKLHLHASKIEIQNFMGTKISVEAPLPKNISDTIEFLGLNKQMH